MTKLAYLCEHHELILKITYSSHIGWSIKIHKRGYDMPLVDVNNKDREIAFNDAYELVKECME